MLNQLIMENEPKPWIYYGIFLDEKSKEELRDFLPILEGWKVYCDHLTVVFNKNLDLVTASDWIKYCESMLGQTISLMVISVGISEKAIAVGINYKTNNRISHITIATAPGVAPVESNNIEEWIPLKNHFELTGTFGVVRPQK